MTIEELTDIIESRYPNVLACNGHRRFDFTKFVTLSMGGPKPEGDRMPNADSEEGAISGFLSAFTAWADGQDGDVLIWRSKPELKKAHSRKLRKESGLWVDLDKKWPDQTEMRRVESEVKKLPPDIFYVYARVAVARMTTQAPQPSPPDPRIPRL